jgi:hypothetical protein
VSPQFAYGYINPRGWGWQNREENRDLLNSNIQKSKSWIHYMSMSDERGDLDSIILVYMGYIFYYAYYFAYSAKTKTQNNN